MPCFEPRTVHLTTFKSPLCGFQPYNGYRYYGGFLLVRHSRQPRRRHSAVEPLSQRALCFLDPSESSSSCHCLHSQKPLILAIFIARDDVTLSFHSRRFFSVRKLPFPHFTPRFPDDSNPVIAPLHHGIPPSICSMRTLLGAGLAWREIRSGDKRRRRRRNRSLRRRVIGE